MADFAQFGFEQMKNQLNELWEEGRPKLSDLGAAFANMIGSAEALSKQFGIGRVRMVELMGTITEATPAVDRLGGNIKDTFEVLNNISKSTRRNVAASTEDISKLYAAYAALGLDTQTLVDNFQEVGVNFTQVGKQLETSLDYIQSVGGNARDIMALMLQDLSAMNRFNFQNGVEGFTKMATQAAMLKVDMRTTLELAEKALDPDGAIELASAFQRLGVSVGELTDPFQLMNMSLNDPEGLQNSIVEMSKQFTSFDEKTKSFKINPQGMLMMREISKQTGISSSELSKMALNASELDRKLSQISPSINFAKDEDRQLLANIATMGKGGEYEVKIGDEQVKLEEITQDQLDKLIEQQSKAPKTLEDLQRSQLDALEAAKADIRSIKDKVIGGVVSAPTIRRESEGARQALTSFSSALDENTRLKFFQESAQGGIDKISELIQTFQREGGIGKDGLAIIQEQFDKLEDLSSVADKKTQDIISSFKEKNAGNDTKIGQMLQDFLIGGEKKTEGKSKTPTAKPTQTTIQPSAGMNILGEKIEDGNKNISTNIGKTNQILGELLEETKKDNRQNPPQPQVEDKSGLQNGQMLGELSQTLSNTNKGLNSLTQVMSGLKISDLGQTNQNIVNAIDKSNTTNQNFTTPNVSPIDPKDVAKVIQTTTSTNLTQTSSKDVNFAGTVTIKIDAPPGVSTQYLTEFVNSTAFHENIYKIWKEKSDELTG